MGAVAGAALALGVDQLGTAVGPFGTGTGIGIRHLPAIRLQVSGFFVSVFVCLLV